MSWCYGFKHLYVFATDIGANLTDGMYKGLYNGSQRHEPDLSSVLSRAWEAGLKHIIVTGGSLMESKEALELVQQDGKYSFLIYFHVLAVLNYLTSSK